MDLYTVSAVTTLPGWVFVSHKFRMYSKHPNNPLQMKDCNLGTRNLAQLTFHMEPRAIDGGVFYLNHTTHDLT